MPGLSRRRERPIAIPSQWQTPHFLDREKASKRGFVLFCDRGSFRHTEKLDHVSVGAVKDHKRIRIVLPAPRLGLVTECFGRWRCGADSLIENIRRSKRAMAMEQVEVMRAPGFERFAVVGHDRDGRVTWQLATEQPQHVIRAIVLDIVPTCGPVTREFATAYFHWFFLTQQGPIPEQLIEGAPETFLRSFLSRTGITPEAFADYLHASREPGTVHGWCEDYRAGMTIDELHEAEMRDRRVTCPLLVLWGNAASCVPPTIRCDCGERWRLT